MHKAIWLCVGFAVLAALFLPDPPEEIPSVSQQWIVSPRGRAMRQRMGSVRSLKASRFSSSDSQGE